MVIFILYSIIYTIYSVKHIEPTPDCRGELLATRCRRQWRGLSPEPRKAGKNYLHAIFPHKFSEGKLARCFCGQMTRRPWRSLFAVYYNCMESDRFRRTGHSKSWHAVQESNKKKAEQIKFSVQPIKLCFITVILL